MVIPGWYRVRSHFVPVLIGLSALLLIGGTGDFPVLAQTETESPIVRIERTLADAVERDAFSGSVLIARNGEILLEQGYGYAVREWEVPNTPDSKYLIASLTKQFTAVAILILQERSLLTVDDPICNHFEDCPEAWSEVTIYHLLTHTSGIPEHASTRAFNEIIAGGRLNDLIDWIRDQPLDFAPGTTWSYSNSGYVLLGEIIKAVSGDSYQTFLRNNIFEPLGMENTGYASNTRVLDHLTIGYATTTTRAAYINMNLPYSAGGLYSTVGDLYRWNQALYGAEIISQETWDTMIERAYTVPDGSGFQYAYGLALDPGPDYRAISHAGGINGYVSVNIYFPDQDTSIIILENMETDPSIYISIFANILFGEQ